MKVLNLQCRHGHGFEGWFASDDDFQRQLAADLVQCPLCSDPQITRLPSAPRLNLSGARAPAMPPAGPPASPLPASSPAAPATGQASEVARSDLQAQWLQAVAHVLKTTEDVGERFAEEARRIHYGESEHRGIRGQASADERAALADEGIEVMPLPLPAGLKGPQH